MTLYAQWAAGTGTAYKVEHWQQNIADDGYTLAKTEPITGTTGEKTAAKAEETAGFSAKEFVQEKIAADGSTVVKIWYDRKIITLTFNADNGEDKTTLSGKFGAEIVSHSPEKTDFNFNGWSTDKIPNESSKSYKDKEKITLTEDLTLYAQWKENPSYSINYNLNEGTNPEDARTSYKQDETVVLPVPTRELYDFAGWHLAQDFSGEVIKGWNAGEKTDAITLYAKWAVKAENVVNAIKNLPEGTHNIFVVGKIDEDTVKNIGELLRSNENVKVNLDLSETTGLESIPKYAFFRCANLINIEIPKSVTSISIFAFGECTGLKNIKISANITNIDDCAFMGCRNVTFLNIENDNKYYQVFNNCVYTKDGQTLTFVFGNPSSITFLQSITSIGAYAFYKCTNLTNTEVPKSVTSIGYSAFEKCTSLSDIEIPAGITSIGNAAFSFCTSLTNIEIPACVTRIGSFTFEGCRSLTNIKIPSTVTSIGNSAFESCTSLTDINIPESVTSIGHSAFKNCTGLTNVRIPASATTIEVETFFRCSNLTTVNYMGTIEQWNSISVAHDNYNLTSAKIICTDGVINGE